MISATRSSLYCAIVLASAAWAQMEPSRNLLENASFESQAGTTVVGWNVDPGAAHARWEVLEGGGHSGRRCLRVTNTTREAPNVFGRLSCAVHLEPGVTYTLSAWVRTDDPGVAWLGTGKQWQFRFAVPRAPEWTRVTGTFVADAEELEVMLNSDSPTPGILIDDVQLERGAEATRFIYAEPPAPGDTRLEVRTTDIASPRRNLIGNSSFEHQANGFPPEWRFDKRNTDATATIDTTVARSGGASLKLTNGTAFGAHVYGLLSYSPEIPVEPSTDYTLSAYWRTQDDTTAWIGGGPEWLTRLLAPRTNGAWERVSVTFRTGADQRTFLLLICTESPTRGVWLDDVKLEKGTMATPYGDEAAEPKLSADLEVPSEVAVGDVLTVPVWLTVPPGSGKVHLAASLGGAEGEPFAEATLPTTVPEGLSQGVLRYGVTPGRSGLTRVTFELASDTAKATASAEFRLVTADEQVARVTRVRQDAARLRAEIEAAARNGKDMAYPRVGLTVLEQFGRFISDDLAAGQVIRAREQLDELEGVRERCAALLARAVAGQLGPVPRYVTSPLRIEDGAFRGTVAWPSGRKERGWPVAFTGYGHFDAVKRDIELMPDYGMNIIQVEFGPNSVLPTEDRIDLTVPEGYVKLLDRAAAAGVQVNLLLSPHYMPDWVFRKWPEVGGVNGGFIRYSVDSPHTRDVIERFLRAAVPVVAKHPALHSFCLSNEPFYADPSKDPENHKAWVAWLTARYGSLEATAHAHGAVYSSWDEVPVLHGPREDSLTPRARYDYMRFNSDRFAGWHRWMADIIHDVAPQVPVHVKIMNTVFSRNLASWGVDPELFCELSQIAGNDCWKYYSHGRGDYASSWQGENQYFDLLRSIRGQPIFNSENHVIADRDLKPVPGNHVRNLIWQAAIHGEGASTTWVWERTLDTRSDFAGSIMHRPECAEAHGMAGLDLLRLGREVNALQTAPARVAIVYSIASLIYGDGYERILSRAYEALNFSGEKLDFITERQLAAGKAARYALIVAPGVTHLPGDAYGGLESYVAGGGRVVAVGDGCLSRDDFDHPRPWSGSDRMTTLAEEPGRALRDRLLPLLSALPGGRPVRVVEADSDADAWGVEWQSVRFGGRLLVNLTNYLNAPVRVRIKGLPASGCTDLVRMQPVGEVQELEPLAVALIAAPTGG